MLKDDSGAPVFEPVQACEGIDPECLVREHIGWMLALAERIVHDRPLAEDAVQDALIDALRGLERFEGRSSLKTWLHRIIINAALAKLRQRKRLDELPIDALQPEFDQDGVRIEAAWTHTPSIEALIERESVRERVTEAIAALPESYRIVLQLRDIQGYDTREVATLLGIDPNNVKVRLHRARAALKTRLEPVLRGEGAP